MCLTPRTRSFYPSCDPLRRREGGLFFMSCGPRKGLGFCTHYQCTFLCFLTTSSLPCPGYISPLLLARKYFSLCHGFLCSSAFSFSPYSCRNSQPSPLPLCVDKVASSTFPAPFPLSLPAEIILRVSPCNFSFCSTFARARSVPIVF